jgi:transcriptional regulator with XRE-family HTH domain
MSEQEQIGARLRELREASGMTARAFADFLGIAETTWNNYERGKRRISIDEALKVASRTGAGLDWIFRGIEHTLPGHVLEKLVKFRKAKEEAEALKKSPTKRNHHAVAG